MFHFMETSHAGSFCRVAKTKAKALNREAVLECLNFFVVAQDPSVEDRVSELDRESNESKSWNEMRHLGQNCHQHAFVLDDVVNTRIPSGFVLQCNHLRWRRVAGIPRGSFHT